MDQLLQNAEAGTNNHEEVNRVTQRQAENVTIPESGKQRLETKGPGFGISLKVKQLCCSCGSGQHFGQYCEKSKHVSYYVCCGKR